MGNFVDSNEVFPAIKRLSYGNIESQIVRTDSNPSFDLLVVTPLKAWFSTYSNKVFYYYNYNIYTYKLGENDSIKYGMFYMNQAGELYAFASQYTYIFGKGYLYTFKFVNGEFQLISKDCLDNYNDPNCLSDMIYRCGTDVMMFNYFGIFHYFDGNKWVYHSRMDSLMPEKVGGFSKDSLVAVCYPGITVCTYGNNKWRRENKNFEIYHYHNVDNSNMMTKNGNIYFTIDDFSSTISYLLIGKPNRKLLGENVVNFSVPQVR